MSAPQTSPAVAKPAQQTPTPPPLPPAGKTAAVPKTDETTASAPAPKVIPTVRDMPPSPLIRIGINANAKELRISAQGEYYLFEKIPESTRRLLHGEVQIRVEQAGEEAGDLFRIQVAALSKASAAEALRNALSEQLAVPARVTEHAVTHLHLVRVGEFRSREEAQQFAAGILKEAGYTDTLVVRENAPVSGGELRMALRGPDNLFRISPAGFLFSPASTANFLRVDGKLYRGMLDLALNKNGRITVVNQLPTEEYLFGVVPAELSPTTYPEYAALAAQAIAARTYALKNTSRYRAEGFDLTADERTQVYGGIAAEKEMTNDIVARTFGLALYYQNNLIDAMYFSTCGGRTEDFSAVFDAPDVPYLRSTTCSIESRTGTIQGTTLAAIHGLRNPILADDGSVANRAMELANALGLVDGADLTTEYLAGSAKEEELRRWVTTAFTLIQGRTRAAATPSGDIASRAGFIRYAAEALYGMPAISARIASSDADYYLNNLKDGTEVPRASRLALAYAIQAGIWRAYPDNSARPNEPVRRSDALALLVRWIESAQPSILQKGSLIGPAANGAPGQDSELALTVKIGSKTREFELAQNLRLFKLGGGGSLSADSLNVIGNEKLTFHLRRDGRIDFLEVELNSNGAASDRYSPLATWDATFSKQQVTQKLSAVAPNMGEIKDLKPARLGKSGRAVQMEILGTKGSMLLNGLKFRNALGLKDTLFTITSYKNPEGEIETFVFHGRGYGHGVGLCQVGAFGMARAGRSFEEILKTYYQGVEIRKAY